jgi:hypothetical protein
MAAPLERGLGFLDLNLQPAVGEGEGHGVIEKDFHLRVRWYSGPSWPAFIDSTESSGPLFWAGRWLKGNFHFDDCGKHSWGGK